MGIWNARMWFVNLLTSIDIQIGRINIDMQHHSRMTSLELHGGTSLSKGTLKYPFA
jgi:hypothetical protein